MVDEGHRERDRGDNKKKSLELVYKWLIIIHQFITIISYHISYHIIYINLKISIIINHMPNELIFQCSSSPYFLNSIS